MATDFYPNLGSNSYVMLCYYKKPTRCNNNNFIINFNQLNMFRAIISPILRSNETVFTACGTMHRRCCLLITWSPEGSIIGALSQAVNTVSLLLRMGEIIAQNMLR